MQILQSGRDTSMVHRRASVKRYEIGDPVYFCFCNMAQFKQYKLGFDRMFFIEEVSGAAAKVQEAALAAQQVAVAVIRPGVLAEEVAANEVYQERGYETGYRTGRSIGVAYLETPELKTGNKTVLQPGMTFAVDGSISVDGKLGGRIGTPSWSRNPDASTSRNTDRSFWWSDRWKRSRRCAQRFSMTLQTIKKSPLQADGVFWTLLRKAWQN
ncbi:MAG: M24 family metallopeptidase [SAR324 cluster bacterium]|nr:M24 family metallopeptidase [SAR324 cluster bacterium]